MSNDLTKTDGNQICNQTLKIRIIKYPYHQLTQKKKKKKNKKKKKKKNKKCVHYRNNDKYINFRVTCHFIRVLVGLKS